MTWAASISSGSILRSFSVRASKSVSSRKLV